MLITIYGIDKIGSVYCCLELTLFHLRRQIRMHTFSSTFNSLLGQLNYSVTDQLLESGGDLRYIQEPEFLRKICKMKQRTGEVKGCKVERQNFPPGGSWGNDPEVYLLPIVLLRCRQHGGSRHAGFQQTKRTCPHNSRQRSQLAKCLL